MLSTETNFILLRLSMASSIVLDDLATYWLNNILDTSGNPCLLGLLSS